MVQSLSAVCRPDDFMSGSNLDAKRRAIYCCTQKTMLPFVIGLVGIVTEIAIVAGLSLVLGKTVPRMPNMVCRFLLLLVLGVPFSFVINCIDVWALGYHKASWTWVIIVAVLLATYGTFVSPRPRRPDTP